MMSVMDLNPRLHLDLVAARVGRPDGAGASPAARAGGGETRAAEAARQFEAFFLEQLLETMERSAEVWKEDGGDSTGDNYLSLARRHLADHLAAAGGIGLGRLMLDQLPGNGQMLDMPLQSPAMGRVSSPFGWRADPFTGRRVFHQGLDLAVPEGTPVSVVGPGTVEWAGHRSGLGLAVAVRHPNGWRSVYGHLSELTVQTGDTLPIGQPVGRSGSTGRATGPHLHLELHDARGPIDPAGVLRLG